MTKTVLEGKPKPRARFPWWEELSYKTGELGLRFRTYLVSTSVYFNHIHTLLLQKLPLKSKEGGRVSVNSEVEPSSVIAKLWS